jgi:hypothetical protein
MFDEAQAILGERLSTTNQVEKGKTRNETNRRGFWEFSGK